MIDTEGFGRQAKVINPATVCISRNIQVTQARQHIRLCHIGCDIPNAVVDKPSHDDVRDVRAK